MPTSNVQAANVDHVKAHFEAHREHEVAVVHDVNAHFGVRMGLFPRHHAWLDPVHHLSRKQKNEKDILSQYLLVAFKAKCVSAVILGSTVGQICYEFESKRKKGN